MFDCVYPTRTAVSGLLSCSINSLTRLFYSSCYIFFSTCMYTPDTCSGVLAHRLVVVTCFLCTDTHSGVNPLALSHCEDLIDFYEFLPQK